MSISTGVVQTREGCLEEVVAYLAAFDEIEVHGVSEESGRLLVVIDAEDEKMEKLCDRIKECEGVVDLLHHSFYFGDNG